MDNPGHLQSTNDDRPAKRRYNEGLAVTRPASSAGVTSASDVSHGWISIMGRSRIMQDSLAVARGIGPGSYDFFFGVYDGRVGPAKWCDQLHELLSEERRAVEGGREGEWREVMEVCFERVDEEVKGRGGGGGVEESKAVVVVVGEEEIVVASRGDSMAVLCRGDVAVGLSRHEPGDPTETSTTKPLVRITNRSRDEDKFVVVASNCLWEVLSDEEACRVVGRCLDVEWVEERGGVAGRSSQGATKAATVLAGLAMARGSKGNISVLVVQLMESV